LTDPVTTSYLVRDRVSPSALAERHARLARRAGIDRLYLVVSFDCDTERDTEVAWKLHERMAELGVPPVWAVPGALLEQGSDEYRRIAAAGGEFINHGYVQHTVWDERTGLPSGNVFYDSMTREEVAADIERGDRAVRGVLGVDPRGFRAPHFGTFQRPQDLRFMHGVLRGLGYEFSTSTVPLYGFRYGPLFDRFGLPELPVSGMASAPLEILDSWGCFAAPDRVHSPAVYRDEAREVAGRYAAAGAGVLNYYVDPDHVHESDEFFDAVRAWAGVAEATTYSRLLSAAG
jgi:hypothetical protein